MRVSQGGGGSGPRKRIAKEEAGCGDDGEEGEKEKGFQLVPTNTLYSHLLVMR